MIVERRMKELNKKGAMYCIRKYADCWALFNLDTNSSRKLTEEEVRTLRASKPELEDPLLVAYYTDRVEGIEEKP